MQLGMKRLILVIVLLSFSLIVLSYAIPQRINYQGVLKNKSTGQILPDGDYSVTFRLYTVSSGGSAIWSEVATVTITNGILTHPLGSVTPLTLAFDANYYLSVQVSGDSEMYPRERLTSVGYAYRAANADNATNVGGVELSGLDDRYLNTSGGDSWQGRLSGSDSTDYEILSVDNNGYGPAIYAQNKSSGYSTLYVEQYGDWRAVSGYNQATVGGTGVGGVSHGLNGIGVYGEAARGIGVYGYSTTTAAIVAVNNGQGKALFARSNNWDNTLEVINGYSGRGIYAESTGYTGIKGVTYGDFATGVIGVSDAEYGTGVSGSSNSILGGTGMSGYASGTGGQGVNGTAYNGVGVYGYSGDTHFGVYGVNGNYGVGVYGKSDSGTGVYGYSSSSYYAMYAENQGSGYGLRSYSRNGYGVYGRTDGSGDMALYGYATGGSATAVRGYSVNYRGSSFYGASRAISAEGDVYISGDLTVTGSKSGFVVDFCKNSGTETLEAGDVVVITGSSPAIIGSIPLMEVAKTSAGYNTAVVGVVNKCLSVTTCTRDAKGLAEAGESALLEKEIDVKANSAVVIQPNEYVNVVTLGAFKAIKVDASYGAIQPGDLLVTSPNPGYAMKADSNQTKVGSVIGKSLGSLASGQGKIPVFVGHQ